MQDDSFNDEDENEIKNKEKMLKSMKKSMRKIVISDILHAMQARDRKIGCEDQKQRKVIYQQRFTIKINIKPNY